jgi:hypothetical protein
VRKAMGQAGFVWQLTWPTGPDGRFKGFAFASYTLRAHAERAVQKLNGMVRTCLWCSAQRLLLEVLMRRASDCMPSVERLLAHQAFKAHTRGLLHARRS